MAQLAEKPTAATPRVGKQGDPCVMVIFGAAGDLTARMLIPALYNLARADLLSKEFAVLGVARTQMSDEDFRKRILDDVKEYCGDCVQDALWETFSRRFIILPAISRTTRFIPRSRTASLKSIAIIQPIKTFSITWRPPRVILVPLLKSSRPPGSWSKAMTTGAA
jgi:hypothetical protein